VGKQKEKFEELNASENKKRTIKGLESKQLWETATGIFDSRSWNVTLLILRSSGFKFLSRYCLL
jgi:hypothetical protein